MKIDHAIASVKQAVFGVLYIMTASASAGTISAVTTTIIELIQMLSFPFTTVDGFPWARMNSSVVLRLGQASELISLSSLVGLRAANIMQMLFWGSLVWMLLFLALLFYVGTGFVKKWKTSAGTLKLTRFIARLSTTSLFLPLVSNLLRVYVCDHTTWLQHEMIACRSGAHYAIAAVTSAALLLCTLLSLFVSAVFIDRNPYSDSWDSKLHGRGDALMLCMKFALSFIFTVMLPALGARAASLLVLVSGLIWVFCYVHWLPHIILAANHMQVACACVYCSACLCLVISAFFSYDSAYVFIFCAPIASVGGWYTHKAWVQSALMVPDASKVQKMRPDLCDAWVRYHWVRGRQQRNRPFQFVGRTSSTRAVDLDHTADSAPNTSAIEVDPLQHIEAVFADIDASNEVDPMTLLYAAQFYRFGMANRMRELNLLNIAISTSSALDLQFFVYERRRRVNEGTAPGHHGKARTAASSQAAIDRVVFDTHKLHAEQAMIACYRLTSALWDRVCAAVPDLKEIAAIGKELHRQKIEASSGFEKVLRIHPSALSVLREYGYFCRNILRDSEKAELLLMKCQRLEEQASRSTQHVQRVTLGLQGHNFDVMDEHSAVLTVSGDLSSIGQILTANSMACRMFGVVTSSLVGQNVSSLMPYPISHVHDKIMTRYIKTGKATVMNSTRAVFIRYAGCQLKPVWMHLRETTSEVDGEAVLAGIFQPIQTAEHHFIALITQDCVDVSAADAHSCDLLQIDTQRISSAGRLYDVSASLPTLREQAHKLNAHCASNSVLLVPVQQTQTTNSQQQRQPSKVDQEVIACVFQRLNYSDEPFYLVGWQFASHAERQQLGLTLATHSSDMHTFPPSAASANLSGSHRRLDPILSEEACPSDEHSDVEPNQPSVLDKQTGEKGKDLGSNKQPKGEINTQSSQQPRSGAVRAALDKHDNRDARSHVSSTHGDMTRLHRMIRERNRFNEPEVRRLRGFIFFMLAVTIVVSSGLIGVYAWLSSELQHLHHVQLLVTERGSAMISIVAELLTLQLCGTVLWPESCATVHQALLGNLDRLRQYNIAMLDSISSIRGLQSYHETTQVPITTVAGSLNQTLTEAVSYVQQEASQIAAIVTNAPSACSARGLTTFETNTETIAALVWGELKYPRASVAALQQFASMCNYGSIAGVAAVMLLVTSVVVIPAIQSVSRQTTGILRLFVLVPLQTARGTASHARSMVHEVEGSTQLDEYTSTTSDSSGAESDGNASERDTDTYSLAIEDRLPFSKTDRNVPTPSDDAASRDGVRRPLGSEPVARPFVNTSRFTLKTSVRIISPICALLLYMSSAFLVAEKFVTDIEQVQRQLVLARQYIQQHELLHKEAVELMANPAEVPMSTVVSRVEGIRVIDRLFRYGANDVSALHAQSSAYGILFRETSNSVLPQGISAGINSLLDDLSRYSALANVNTTAALACNTTFHALIPSVQRRLVQSIASKLRALSPQVQQLADFLREESSRTVRSLPTVVLSLCAACSCGYVLLAMFVWLPFVNKLGLTLQVTRNLLLAIPEQAIRSTPGIRKAIKGMLAETNAFYTSQSTGLKERSAQNQRSSNARKPGVMPSVITKLIE